MNHLPPLLTCLAGFVTLALAMDRPQETVLGHALSSGPVAVLRLVGTGLLLAALGWLIHEQGWSMGLVIYSGHTSLSAGLVFCALVVWARFGQQSVRTRCEPTAQKR